jgi:catechol 2,3-dioxygenase-like lactoylglutathione lyase family enzyme
VIRVKKISHAVYETPDLVRQTEYYTDILGLGRIADDATGLFEPWHRDNLQMTRAWPKSPESTNLWGPPPEEMMKL